MVYFERLSGEMTKEKWQLKIFTGLLLLSCAAVSNAATFHYTDDGCESFSMSGSNGSFEITCNRGGGDPPPITAPSGCGLAANPTSLSSSGGTVMLTLTCSGQTDSSTTYEFFQGGASLGAASTTNTKSAPVSANSGSSTQTKSFTARACNGTSCSSYATASVTVAASSGGGGGDDLCTGYNVISAPLPKGTARHDLNNFGGNSAFVGSFVAGSTVGSGKVSVVYINTGAKGELVFSISEHKCDFRAVDNTGANGPEYLAYTTNASGNKTYYVGKSNGLEAGRTYYINIAPRVVNGVKSCASSDCDFAVGHQ